MGARGKGGETFEESFVPIPRPPGGILKGHPMSDEREVRPDPDALLKRVEQAERRQARGRLRVFFGMCPGVGKTYAMLEKAG